MKPPKPRDRRDAGPTQRQLRAGELVRHALAEILREEEIADPALPGVSVTVTEVRMSPDLKHAICFVEPLGGAHASDVIAGLNRNAKFLRGRLGRAIELKFIPDLKFIHDETFDEAARIGRLFAKPEVQRDLAPFPPTTTGAIPSPSPLRGEGWGGGERADERTTSDGGASRLPLASDSEDAPTLPSPLDGEGKRIEGEGSR